MAQSSVSIRNLVIVVFAILVVGGGYDGADEKGWIPHSGNAQITYPHHGWEIGGYVTCTAAAGTPDNFMDCNEDIFNPGTVREMSVTFWGRLGKDPKTFKCQRGQEKITCHLP